MPRLIGKQSNRHWYAGLFVVVAIATTASLEYFGTINLVPGFGQDHQLPERSQPESNS